MALETDNRMAEAEAIQQYVVFLFWRSGLIKTLLVPVLLTCYPLFLSIPTHLVQHINGSLLKAGSDVHVPQRVNNKHSGDLFLILIPLC